jgi:DNA repair protein RecO (recombination protein O)
MKLESEGIVIDLRPFGERDLLGRVFTADFGVLCGIFKAGQIARSRPLMGQLGRVSWSARLDSQLGAFHFESEKNLAALLFGSHDALKYAQSCFALLAAFMPEREACRKLYAATISFLAREAQASAARAGISPFDYVSWELTLLSELGYGLALDRCGNCGAAESLAYISPKTGRAICAKCGAPHKDKLFRMPVALDATKYFLSQIAGLPVPRQVI